jgi:hypothetical protein
VCISQAEKMLRNGKKNKGSEEATDLEEHKKIS